MRAFLRFGSVLSRLVLVGALTISSSALAQSEAPGTAAEDQRALARDAFLAGREAYQAGKFEEALRQFLRAAELAPNPRLFVYLSQSERALGNWERARLYLTKFAATSPAAAEESAVLMGELTAVIRTDAARLVRERVEDAIVKANGSTPPPRSAQRYALGSNVRDVPVQIASNPPGAAIFVDDVELGSIGNTPLQTRLFVGPHLIALEMPNKKPVQRVVQVVPPQSGEEIPRVSFELEPLQVTVALTSEPAAATVWYIAADGSRRRLGLGTFRGELPAGNCTFILQQGGRDRRIPFVVSPSPDGSPTSIRLSMNEAEAARGAPVRMGHLRVVMEGLRGDLYVDGQLVATAPGEKLVDLPAGPHKLELRRKGHLTWIQTIKVGPDAETVVYPSDMPED